MKRIKGIYKISNISSVGKTAIIEVVQPGEKKAGESVSTFPRKSSVGTTDINNGFQPGEKKRTYNTIFIGEKSSVGTTDSIERF